MTNQANEKKLRRLTAQLADLFSIETTYHLPGDRVQILLGYRYGRKRSKKLLTDRLELAGYDFKLHDLDNALALETTLATRIRIPKLNIILFLVTVMSVYFVPVFLNNLLMVGVIDSAVLEATFDDLRGGAGLIFTIAMISILFVHEMGHYIAGRRRGIITSWPFFIPAPSFIGTLGAIIKSKSPFWNRRDLVEVGASGPIAGWIVAVGWLVYGLAHSQIITAEALPVKGLVFSLYGESILVKWLVPLLIGPAGENAAYLFSEAAFAGWAGLLITAMNMLPIGQLDGGHVTYGLGPRLQPRLGWVAMAGLLVMGFYSPVWWILAVMGFLFRVKHPPTLEDQRELPRSAMLLGLAAWFIFLVSFTPIPVQ